MALDILVLLQDDPIEEHVFGGAEKRAARQDPVPK